MTSLTTRLSDILYHVDIIHTVSILSDSKHEIYFVYDEQSRLLELFPEEGGTKDPTQRMIPFLPGETAE